MSSLLSHLFMGSISLKLGLQCRTRIQIVFIPKMAAQKAVYHAIINIIVCPST